MSGFLSNSSLCCILSRQEIEPLLIIGCASGYRAWYHETSIRTGIRLNMKNTTLFFPYGFVQNITLF